MHITLYFAGDLDNRELDILNSNVERAAAKISSFPLTLNGTGAFLKDRRGGGAFWIGLVENADDLGKLNEVTARV